jgi:hypothetical protein
MQTINPKLHCARCGGSLAGGAVETCETCLPLRVFAGIFPTGISYADRQREEGGDYARLAFFTFRTLELEFSPGCPRELQAKIVAHAEKIKARRGEQYEVSTSGQAITLGYGL